MLCHVPKIRRERLQFCPFCRILPGQRNLQVPTPLIAFDLEQQAIELRPLAKPSTKQADEVLAPSKPSFPCHRSRLAPASSHGLRLSTASP